MSPAEIAAAQGADWRKKYDCQPTTIEAQDTFANWIAPVAESMGLGAVVVPGSARATMETFFARVDEMIAAHNAPRVQRAASSSAIMPAAAAPAAAASASAPPIAQPMIAIQAGGGAPSGGGSSSSTSYRSSTSAPSLTSNGPGRTTNGPGYSATGQPIATTAAAADDDTAQAKPFSLLPLLLIAFSFWAGQ